MDKHTSGPWRVEGQDIYGNQENGYICTWSGRRADALLIRAAPELLDAIKDMLSSIDCTWEIENQEHDFAKACARARRAIDKAEKGEEDES